MGSNPILSAMAIHGFNKLTLLDYPGKCAATVFLGGCNFRCPFCQNSELVISPMSQPVIKPEEVLKYLGKRKGILDGVCVTGGEPTLEPDLKSLLKEIKKLGYLIKLDTNGSHPEVMEDLAAAGLIDTVAMDVKSSPEHYAKAAGVPGIDLIPVGDSVQFLLKGKLPYEFRTTVVRELHEREDFISIGKWIAGAQAYYLQAFRDSENVMSDGFSSYTYKELNDFRKLLEKTIPKVGIRGIDA